MEKSRALKILFLGFMSVKLFAADVKVDCPRVESGGVPVAAKTTTELSQISRKACEELDPCDFNTIKSCEKYLDESAVHFDESLGEIFSLKNSDKNVRVEVDLVKTMTQLIIDTKMNEGCLKNLPDKDLNPKMIEALIAKEDKNPIIKELKLSTGTKYTQNGFINMLLKYPLKVGDRLVINKQDIYSEGDKFASFKPIDSESDNSAVPEINLFLNLTQGLGQFEGIFDDESNLDLKKTKAKKFLDENFSNHCSFEAMANNLTKKSYSIPNKLCMVIKNNLSNLNFDSRLKLCSENCSFSEGSASTVHFSRINGALNTRINTSAFKPNRRAPASVEESDQPAENTKPADTSGASYNGIAGNHSVVSNTTSNNDSTKSKIDNGSIISGTSFNNKHFIADGNDSFFSDMKSSLDEINNRLSPIIENGESISEKIPPDELKKIISDLKEMKESVNEEKKKENSKNGKKSTTNTSKIAERELVDAIEKLEKAQTNISSSDSEINNLKKMIQDLKAETKSVKDSLATSDENQRKLKAENDYLKQQNYIREKQIQNEREERERNAAVAQAAPKAINQVDNSSASRSISSFESSSSMPTSNFSNIALRFSNVDLVLSKAQVDPSSAEKIIISKSEFQAYPYKLAANASDIEITNLLLKSNGNAILIGDSEQLVPEIVNGKIVFDESGKPKYKIKKLKISIVSDADLSKAQVAKLDRSEVDRVLLSDLNALHRNLK